jgi:hypothetical protein
MKDSAMSPLTSSIIELSSRCNHKILWSAHQEARQKRIFRWRGAAKLAFRKRRHFVGVSFAI